MTKLRAIDFFQNLAFGWGRKNGYRDVLKISLPLVVSMTSHTVMLFTDRLFLSRYSVDAIAASTPAGLMAFMFMCFFSGVIGFANTLIAQSVGAGERSQVARSLWQAVYFAIFSGIILAGLSFGGDFIFRVAGHEAGLRSMETVYFSILMQGAIFALLHDALACFYSGQGLTRAIMFVNVAGVLVNIPLDYVLIFGVAGLPGMGIAGAALATIFGHVLMLAMYVLLVFSRKNRSKFGLWREHGFDRVLSWKLVKFGAPAGLQFFIDIFAFTYFLMMIGRIGRDALAATNIAFALNSLAFMPMIGFSIAVSSLVGQAMGGKRPEHGVTATQSALHLTLAYMWLVACLFMLFPDFFCGIFKASGENENLPVLSMASVLLRFVAFYSLVDGLNVIYSGALKGAGDTAFIGWTIVVLSLFFIIIPVYLAVAVWHAGLYTAWILATFYVCASAYAFRWRFRQGKWKSINVMESKAATLEVSLPRPEIPGAEEL